ncbi:hypothetical protein [Halomonas sp. HAL1]|uniref:hypothetical protein n=1 Tax=Halomonas sp. HAL1 TaxID=550984 RepID=UPI00022D2886|nr:hypothetical protein [Halomonas sp. HAL1]EHA17622.1 hypothetical protein HAL1_00290 [Halomonas sp. HAL1]WKV92194.1 hypothetical protein Q3Y66_15190 [Halomonas sp. HAL1]
MVSQANTSSHPDYNNIFEKLVVEAGPDSKERLIGMLAYADYKEEKYQWKEQYRLTQQVDTIPADDVNKFLLAYHDGKLEKLRSDAEEVLYVFAEHYAEERAEEAYNEALGSELLSQVKAQKDGWWISGGKGALGSFLFASFAVVVSIFFSVASPDSNYAKLVHFVIGNKDFLVLEEDDCRLKSSDVDCINRE